MFNNNEDEYFEYYLYENISLDYKLRANYIIEQFFNTIVEMKNHTSDT